MPSTSRLLTAAVILGGLIAYGSLQSNAATGPEFIRITDRQFSYKRVDIGVSQSSEIVQASPDALAGPFPKEYALNTDFTLWHRNNISSAAKDFVGRLTSTAGREKLAADGVVPPAGR